jgi:undecaprenyl-diphosphatase
MPEKRKALLFALFSLLAVVLSFYMDGFFAEFLPVYRNAYLDIFFSLITNAGIVLVGMYFIPLLILRKKGKETIARLSFALAAAITAGLLIKIIFLRERPSIEIDYGIFRALDFSFPSMHAMMVFSLLPILTGKLPKYGKFWLFSAFAVAFSRAYLQFHFMSDIIAGGLIGYSIGYLSLNYNKKLPTRNFQ